MKRVNAGLVQGSMHEELLLLLGEELKNPLVQIAQLAELGGKDPMIRAQVQKALNTIDSVLMYKRFASGQTALRLEPVHIGSTITDVAAALAPQMRMSGHQSQLVIQQSLGSVDVDRQLLSGALCSLWQAFITNATESAGITCAARRIAGGGIRLSIVSDGFDVSSFSMAKANLSSRQPLRDVAGPAADLLAARGMFDLVGGTLAKTKVMGQGGFGVTLPASRQLVLI